jgi:hypothetical protein
MNMLHEKLTGKNVLYIGVKFYHYSGEIQKKIKAYGGKVTFYPERDTSIRYGIVNRLFPKYLDQYQKFYYTSLLHKIKKERFDYFLVIRGHRMPIWFVQEVKRKNPGIVCIMYQWDANVNSPFLNLVPEYDLIPEFHKVISFDYKDVEENPGVLNYSPTFYTDEIKELGNKKNIEIKYDLFFFGSYLPERYKGLLKIKTFAEQNGYRLKTHFYMPLRYYLMERMKGTPLDRSLLQHRKMDRSEYMELFEHSRVIVDVSNEKQTGLAMRVLDAIGAGKKVITTNKWAFKENGLNSKQVFIINFNNIDIPKDFIYEPVEATSVNDYSIDNWLRNMFS